MLKGGYPIIFASNVFHNSHLIQKCIQNQQHFWNLKLIYLIIPIFDLIFYFSLHLDD